MLKTHNLKEIMGKYIAIFFERDCAQFNIFIKVLYFIFYKKFLYRVTC